MRGNSYRCRINLHVRKSSIARSLILCLEYRGITVFKIRSKSHRVSPFSRLLGPSVCATVICRTFVFSQSEMLKRLFFFSGLALLFQTTCFFCGSAECGKPPLWCCTRKRITSFPILPFQIGRIGSENIKIYWRVFFWGLSENIFTCEME